MEITRNEIHLSIHHLRKLEKEFDKSRPTIYNALKDITKSDLSRQIRLRAKELLIQEADNIKE